MGTKTEAHVKTFYVNHRRRYNLDQIIKKFEADKEANATNATTSANTTTTSSSSGSSLNATNINSTTSELSAGVSNASSSGSIKKDDSTNIKLKKKEIVPNSVNEESDNTTSSETAISKSTISTITTTTDERKSESSLSGVTKDNIILEVNIITKSLKK